MNHHSRTLLVLNLAVVLLGLNSLFAKAISLDAGSTIFFRAMIAMVSLFCLKAWMKDRSTMKMKEIVLQILLGLLMGLHWITFFHAIKISSIALGLISTFTFPVVTALLEPLITKKPHHSKDLLFSLFAFTGILIMVPNWEIADQSTQGILWGLLSSVVFSLRNIWSRKSVETHSSVQVMGFQMLGVILISAPFLFQLQNAPTAEDVLFLFLMGVVTTACAHTLFINSLKHLKAKTASIFSSMQVVYGVLFAFLIFQEVPSGREIFGGGVILLAVIFESITHYKKKSEVIEMEN